VNGACECEAVTLAFSCARTQLPMRPHLAPHELGLGKMPMEVSSGEPGSMLPIASHGPGPIASPSYQTTIAYTICLTNLPNNRHLHRIGLSSPYTCNQSRRKQPKRVTQIGAFLHFWISEHMSKRDITKMICPIPQIKHTLSWVSETVSHPKLSILECEPFSTRNSKFLKGFQL
jgi:hypothetical protein